MTRKRLSLAQQAYSAIKRDIVSSRLRPGELIVEGDLAAAYGMSKTPIREALNLLQREGFVVILPRRGTMVKPIDVQDVQHTFFLRMLVEPEAAALAATRATGPQLKQLTDLSVSSRKSQTGKTLPPAERLANNRLFHVAIAEASGIPRLVSIIAGLHEEVERFYNSERLRAVGDPTGQHHHELLEAIVAGDAERARTIMADSIRISRQHLIESLIEDPRPVGLAIVDRSA